jgi:hypothetical protein
VAVFVFVSHYRLAAASQGHYFQRLEILRTFLSSPPTISNKFSTTAASPSSSKAHLTNFISNQTRTILPQRRRLNSSQTSCRQGSAQQNQAAVSGT